MFWNDPNLYSVAFKDVPTPRFFNPYINFTPYMNPMLFNPQFTPQFTPHFGPQITPQFGPQFPPVTPFFHGQNLPFFAGQNLPWVDRPVTSPYGYNIPYFQGYRPFGL